MKTFLEKNKVLLIGLLGSIGIALNAFVGQSNVEIKPLIYAIIAAGLSYFANNLRGQWVSISGILLTLFSTYVTMEQSGTISWQQLFLQAAVAFIAVVSPPPKDLGYEKSTIIIRAKEEGQSVQNKIEHTPPPQL